MDIEKIDHVFKAYDIRGLADKELDESFAYLLGLAFVAYLKKRKNGASVGVGLKTDDESSLLEGDRGNVRGVESFRILVAGDMRVSTPPLKDALIKGIVEAGGIVFDGGMVPTPTFYFGVGKYKLDAGIQVTASHNPAEWNGFKIVLDKALPVGLDSGLREIKNLMAEIALSRNGKIEIPASENLALEKLNNLPQEEAKFAYEFTGFQPADFPTLSVAIDAGNGLGGTFVEALFLETNLKILPLFFEPDGNFPNHEADPLNPENNLILAQKIVAKKADLGIAYDGDGDRIFFFDELGAMVEPHIIRAISAEHFLKIHPGAAICYDIRPGRITEEAIVRAGGKPIITKVGHSLIKQKMLEVDAPFAGESSGHLFVRTAIGSFEMPQIIVLIFLKLLKEAGCSVSKFVAPYRKYAHSGEINFDISDKNLVMQKLQERYSSALTYDFDGLTFAYPEVWFNVRFSNTVNKMRLNVEGLDNKVVAEKVKEVSEIVLSISRTVLDIKDRP